MAQSYFETILTEKPADVDPKGKPGFTDYVTDIPVGAFRGVSIAVRELVKLGFLPIDYLADTNIRSAIDRTFERITPDVDTPVGEISSVLGQFGAPAGLLVKLSQGIKALSGLNQMKKLSSFKKVGGYDVAGAGAELTKRAAYYGGIGGITDFAVSSPGENRSIAQTLGYGEDYKGDMLTGSAKAAEDFKQKIKFGAEGTLIGGGVTAALPIAGTLGAKFGLMAAKPVGYVAGKTLEGVNFAVVNPLSKIIGSETVGKGVTYTKKQLDKVLPDTANWKFLSKSPTAPFKDRLKKRFDNFKNIFKSPGPLDLESKRLLEKVGYSVNRDEKLLIKLMDDIDKGFKDIAGDYNVRFKEGFRSVPINQRDNDLIFNYLTKGRGEAQLFYDQLPSASIKRSARRLKAKMRQLGKNYGRLLQEDPNEAIRDIGANIIQNGGAYLRQVFSAFKNKDYAFDVAKVKGAGRFFKDMVRNDRDLMDNVDILARQRNPKLAELPIKDLRKTKEWETSLNRFSLMRMNALKKQIIESDRSPDTIFNAVGKVFKLAPDEKGFLKAGGNVNDFVDVRGIKPVADAFLKTSKDYRAAVTDTFMQNAKSVYQKKFFDDFADTGLRNGLVFKSPAEAIAKGIPTTNNLQKIAVRQHNGEFFQSKLFKDGIDDTGQYGGMYTTPEIANAIRGIDDTFGSLYDIPLYKALMSVKATGQIGKTIFSPMTQIRNVSTASFFPLASGLIGGRVSLGDSFKLLADDLFPGKNVDAVRVARVLGDKIERGVIDTNIEVNEIKTILQQAKDGKFTLSALMNNPTVKKAFDLYQGGDNVWKVYSDEFYQDALDTAFKFNPRGLQGEKAIRANITDWYKTVGKEPTKLNKLTNINRKIDDIDLKINQASTPIARQGLNKQRDALIREFNETGNIKDISAYLVTNTIPTYSKVPEIIRGVRKLPIGNFIAFPAEILRTGANLIAIGSRELTSTNPFIRQMGARRMIGGSAVFGGIGTIVSQTAEAITGVDREKMDAFKRSAAPVYQKNATLIPLTEPDKNGNFKYFNFSYSNPYDSLVRPINAILNNLGNGELTQATVDEKVMNALFGDPLTNTPGAISEFFDPFISESIGSEAIFDIAFRKGETRDGKRIYFENDSLNEKIDKSIGHLFTQLEPGASRSARRVYKAATGSFTQFGTLLDTETELGALLAGVRVEDAKPLTSMPFIITAFGKDKVNIRRKFGRNAFAANAAPEQRLAAFKEYVVDTFNNQKIFHQVLKDMKTLNIPNRKIEDILQARLRNKSEVEALLEGEFRPPNFSEETFDELINRLKIEDPIEAAKVRTNIRQDLRTMEKVLDRMDRFDFDDSVQEVDEKINEILFPRVSRIRDPQPSVNTGILTQKINLPQDTNIGTPINNQILSIKTQPTLSLGEKFNILFR